MSALGKIALPVPVDPVTTKLLGALPKPLQTIANPAGPALKAALGPQGAKFALDPLGLGTGNPAADQQEKTLLGE